MNQHEKEPIDCGFAICAFINSLLVHTLLQLDALKRCAQSNRTPIHVFAASVHDRNLLVRAAVPVLHRLELIKSF